MAVHGIEAEQAVVCPWMFGGRVRETVIVPSTPDAPNRPVIAPSKVLTEKLRSSPIAKGPANRFCVAEEPWER